MAACAARRRRSSRTNTSNVDTSALRNKGKIIMTSKMRNKICRIGLLLLISSFAITDLLAQESSNATSEKKIDEVTTLKPQIRWKFERGNNIRYKYVEATHVEVYANTGSQGMAQIGKAMDVTINGIFEFAPNLDNTANLKIKIDDIKSSEDSGDSMPQLNQSLDQQKAEVTVLYNQNGTIGLLDENEENAEDAMEVQLALDKMFQLPENPSLFPGDVFEKQLDYFTKFFDTADASIKTTFVGWEEKGGAKLAKFSSIVGISAIAQEGNNSVDMKINGKGLWFFDPAVGKLISSEFNYHIDLNLKMSSGDEDAFSPSGEGVEIISKGDGKISFELE